jgi:glycosyltransferase involved in cell wall biosynthesis
MVIDGETGWLAEPGSPDELAAVLEKAMTSEALRRQYGRAARARIAALGMNRATMLERHQELYEPLLRRSFCKEN